MLKRILRDCEYRHKSQRRTLQLLPVSACGEDIEIFAIATLEDLSLDVIVVIILFTLGFFLCVFPSDKSVSACKLLLLL